MRSNCRGLTWLGRRIVRGPLPVLIVADQAGDPGRAVKETTVEGSVSSKVSVLPARVTSRVPSRIVTTVGLQASNAHHATSARSMQPPAITSAAAELSLTATNSVTTAATEA